MINIKKLICMKTIIIAILISCINIIDIYSANSSDIIISPSTLPNSILNITYTQELDAIGGDAPYTFTVTSGALPAGISLDSRGLISGIPTVSGTYSFDITATDINKNSSTQSYTFNVIQMVVTIFQMPTNEKFNLIAVSDGGVGPYEYEWSNLTTGANVGDTDSIIAIAGNKYRVIATDSAGASSSATIIAGLSKLRTELLIRNANPDFIPCACGTPIVLEVIIPKEAVPPLSYLWKSNDPAADGRTTRSIVINPTVTSQYTITITDSSDTRRLIHRALGGTTFNSAVFTAVELPNTQDINRSALSTAISNYSSCSTINNRFRSKLVKRDVILSEDNFDNRQNNFIQTIRMDQGSILSQAIAGSQSTQITRAPSANPPIINAYPTTRNIEVLAGDSITLILNLTDGSLTPPLIYTLVDSNRNSFSQIDNNDFTFTPSISNSYVGFITDANGNVTFLSNKVDVTLIDSGLGCRGPLQGAGLCRPF